MFNFSLLKRFTILSFIAFIITGFTLGFFISNHIKDDKLKDIKMITTLTLDAVFKPLLELNDFDTSFSEKKIKVLDAKFVQVLSTNKIVGIKIWDRNSNIFYSNKSDLIGKHFETDNNLEQAFDNKIMLNISKADKYDNKDLSANYSEVIEIYEPIIFNNRVVGAFEVFIPYDEVKQHIDILNRTIMIVMSLGLFVLYLFLLKMINNASKTLIVQNESLIKQTKELEESYMKLNSSYKNTIITLSNAVDARDPYTAGHSGRVAAIALEIGRELNLNKEQLERLELSALFHDIGKIGIRDEILNKPGKLTESEFEKVKEHPQIGINILKNIDFLKSSLQIILHHHEKFSGGGYPEGIKECNIPLESRIITIADSFDAMTSDRTYRKGLDHMSAVKEILKFRGIQFDPEIVDAFLKIELSELRLKPSLFNIKNPYKKHYTISKSS